MIFVSDDHCMRRRPREYHGSTSYASLLTQKVLIMWRRTSRQTSCSSSPITKARTSSRATLRTQQAVHDPSRSRHTAHSDHLKLLVDKTALEKDIHWIRDAQILEDMDHEAGMKCIQRRYPSVWAMESAMGNLEILRKRAGGLERKLSG